MFNMVKNATLVLLGFAAVMCGGFVASGMGEPATAAMLLIVVLILFYIVMDLKQRVVHLENVLRKDAMVRHPAKGGQS